MTNSKPEKVRDTCLLNGAASPLGGDLLFNNGVQFIQSGSRRACDLHVKKLTVNSFLPSTRTLILGTSSFEEASANRRLSVRFGIG